MWIVFGEIINLCISKNYTSVCVMVRILFQISALVILALGITFLVWGIDLMDTFSNRFMKEMAGEYPNETKWYFFSGIAMIVAGAGILVASFFKHKK